MNSLDCDKRLELEALEFLCVGRAAGAAVETVDLSSFTSGDPIREAAARRALRTVVECQSVAAGAAGEAVPGGTFGPYTLLKLLGAGGQGEVWLAEDGRLPRFVALKVLLRGAATDADAIVRFRHEAAMTSRIDHPGFCHVFDVGAEGDRTWMALRFVEGRSLGQILKLRGADPPSAAEVSKWTKFIRDAARAVHHAHEAGFVHRDLKPSNLMVSAGDAPVILDLGLAKDLLDPESSLTRSAAMFGTPKYMAPEQFLGVRDVDRRADVFALASVLFHATTGAPARKDPTPEVLRATAWDAPPSARAANGAVPRDLDAVLSVAMAPAPEHRYFSAQDFADDLDRVLTNVPILARRPSILRRAASWTKRNRLLALAIGIACATMIGGTIVSTALRRQSEERLSLVSRLGELRAYRILVDQEQTLRTIEPETAPKLDAWLEEARALLRSGPSHRAALATLRGFKRSSGDGAEPAYRDRNDARLDDMLSELCANVESLSPLIAKVEERVERCRTAAARSIEGSHAAVWADCIEAIAAAPVYGGLKLRPQLGLLPLAPDAQSGLWEFLLVESGEAPPRDPKTGRLTIDEAAGLVFVLIPGGVYKLGTNDTTRDYIEPLERPAWSAALDPYFISKFEMTQAQWMRLSDGVNPAYYRPGARTGIDEIERRKRDLRHPVESVSALDAQRLLSTWRLTLPTEARWEAAARAGTDTLWWTGNDPVDLRRSDNCAALESSKNLHGTGPAPLYFDSWRASAPVGSLMANPFGLHDVHGNVGELCVDVLIRDGDEWLTRPGDGLRTPVEDSPDNVAIRGGSMRRHAFVSRTTSRHFTRRNESSPEAGVRPARDLDK